MRRFLFFSIVVSLTCCSPEPEEPVLVPIISDIEIFDVGNAGNSSDLRIRFVLEAIANVNEARILILPSSELDNFTKKQALRLSEDQFISIPIQTTNTKYSMRLTDIKDVMDKPIEIDMSYVVKILMVGENFNQLSIIESNEFTLTNRGPYDGTYIGLLWYYDTSNNYISFESRMVIVYAGNNYKGIFSHSGQPEEFKLEFSVDGTELVDFVLIDGNEISNPTGSITNDLVIDFSFKNPVDSFEVILRRTLID